MPLNGIEELIVKPGDQVCFLPHYPHNTPKDWEILTVITISPKAGQITTTVSQKGSYRFDKDGTEMGGSRSQSGSRNSIHMLTEDMRDRMIFAKNLEIVKRLAYHLDSLTPAQAAAIVAVMRGNEDIKTILEL